MVMQMGVMVIQTLLLWFLVFWLHLNKQKLTLVPFYCLIAFLALATHNLSDLGFAISTGGWYFLIASVSFFTSLMLGILILYLFEGPRATRLAIGIVLGVSILYVFLVWLLGLQADTSKWVTITPEKYRYYFWSLLAIVIDVFFVAIFWELLGRIKQIPQILQVFLVVLLTYFLDTAIFVTGFFGGQEAFLSILSGNLVTRLVLAIMMTPVISFYLNREGFSEERRDKPKNLWEITNFQSDLETQIKSMEELERELRESEERYSLAVQGVNAGIWEWIIPESLVTFSAKFYSLLGYELGDLGENIDSFKKIIYQEDLDDTFSAIEENIVKKDQFSAEYRLKTKSGDYKWFQVGGIVKYNDVGKPIRVIGSIIDVDEKKRLFDSYEDKVNELEKLNRLMVDRELKMVELKREIERLKGK